MNLFILYQFVLLYSWIEIYKYINKQTISLFFGNLLTGRFKCSYKCDVCKSNHPQRTTVVQHMESVHTDCNAGTEAETGLVGNNNGYNHNQCML